jgi:hypothetical protein
MKKIVAGILITGGLFWAFRKFLDGRPNIQEASIDRIKKIATVKVNGVVYQIPQGQALTMGNRNYSIEYMANGQLVLKVNSSINQIILNG